MVQTTFMLDIEIMVYSYNIKLVQEGKILIALQDQKMWWLAWHSGMYSQMKWKKNTMPLKKKHMPGCTYLYVSKTSGNCFPRALTGSSYFACHILSLTVCHRIQQNMLILRAGNAAVRLVTEICETPDFSDHQPVCGCDGFLVRTHQQILIVSWESAMEDIRDWKKSSGGNKST